MDPARVEILDDKGRYAEAMYSALVTSIAKKYDLQNWIRHARAKELAPDIQEQFEEGAAIREIEGGMLRSRAEEEAAADVFAMLHIF